MKKNLTEMVFILDCSGSMHGLEKDTIGGYNSMLEKQKKLDDKAYVSTILFNSKSHVISDRVDIQQVKTMSEKDYQASGCTALLDAIGGAIHHIGNIHKYARKEDIPKHTIFVITTDGMENASHKYSLSRIKAMIDHQKQKYNWEFLFLGANIDAIETAKSFGIDENRSVNFNCDSEGTSLNYDVISETIHHFRANACIDDSWKQRIEKDFKKRHKK